MSTKQYDNYADLITFSRASGGTALRKIAYGSELVTNGTFDTDVSGWAGGNATLSAVSASLRVTNDSSNYGYSYQAISTVIGKTYAVSVTRGSTTSGAVPSLRVGTSIAGFQNKIILVSSAGDYTAVFVATSTTTYISVLVGSNVAGQYTEFDNVSVKEVLFDQGDLTLFNHPAGIPRIEYDADGNVLGLLVEESRTNLVTYSEDFSQWSAVGAGTSIVSLSELDPAGSSNAALIKNTGGAYSIASSNITTSLGDTYTVSFWVKSAGLGNDSFRLYFDGSVISGNFTATSEWQRFSFTGTSDGSGSVAVTRNTSNDPFDLYIWGAQLEAGAFPTSYIPTAGATATRSADVASIPVADFGYNQSEGSVVVEGSHFETSITDAHAAFGFDDGTSNNRMWFYHNKGQWIGSTAGSTTLNVDLPDPTKYSLHRSAMCYKENDSALTIDASSVTVDSACTVPSVDTLHIGNTGTASTPLNGHIKSINYYPRRLTNAQLQELTT